MTQSFDEWFEKNGELYREPTSDERYLFEAGQQSRQAEVDELKQRITMLEIDVHIRDGVIEQALTLLEGFNCPEEYEVDEIYKAIEILKGKEND